EARHTCANRWLSGSGLAGPTACRWGERSEDFWRKNRGESDHSYTRRIQRTRRPDRFNALVRRNRAERTRRRADSPRSPPARRACETYPTAPPIIIETAEDGRGH